MNDEFLTQFRESPRPTFAHTLYDRISKEPGKVGLRTRLASSLTWGNALILLSIVIMVAACTYVITVPKWIEVGDDLWVQEKNSTNELLDGAEPPSTFFALPLLSIEDAKAQSGFEFQVPTWIPSDFILEGASLSDKSDIGFERINFFWDQDNSVGEPWKLAFQAYYTKTWIMDEFRYVPFGMYVGDKSTKLTEINGKPAILIYGDWDFQIHLETSSSGRDKLAWNKDVALQLLWREGEVVYRIYAVDPSLSPDDLIRMAESVR